MRSTILLECCVVLAAGAPASILSSTADVVAFNPADPPEGATWSSQWQLTDHRLVFPPPAPGTSYEAWFQTGPLPVGLAWRPPSSARFAITVQGEAEDGFPLDAFARYGCDGVHWSTWYPLTKTASPPFPLPGAVQSYSLELRVPYPAQQAYRNKMQEWWRTDPDWSSDEDAFCRWLTEQEPDFFAREMPFLGYVQFLFESAGLGQDLRIQAIHVQKTWGVGGLSSIPKPGVQTDSEGPWHFRLTDVTR